MEITYNHYKNHHTDPHFLAFLEVYLKSHQSIYIENITLSVAENIVNDIKEFGFEVKLTAEIRLPEQVKSLKNFNKYYTELGISGYRFTKKKDEKNETPIFNSLKSDKDELKETEEMKVTKKESVEVYHNPKTMI